MIKRGKKYKQASSLIEKNKVYSAKEACELIKKTSTTKFDASVDVAFNLNIDTRYAEQQIRGAVVLPNGTGKTKTVLAITNKQEEAKNAGAMGLFGNKYEARVKVYTMGDVSKEICGGPHATNTSQLGHFKIQKEESSSRGVRRIKAVLN